jgi:hypothetical protein
MGQQSDFPYETTIERFRGNRKSIGDSTAHLKVMVEDLPFPHCGQEAVLFCVPREKFIADMLSQGLGSVQLPAWDQLGSENKIKRSRSIPIKIKTAVADDSDRSRDNMYQYDLATWRMYNRIVVHRLKCPVCLSQKVAPGVSRQASDIATLQCELHHSSDNEKLFSCEMVDPMPVPDSNYYLEGEVFELEL